MDDQRLRPTKLSEYLAAARLIKSRWQSASERPSEFVVLSSFSADFLAPYLIVESDEMVPLRPAFAPFGQFEQLALDAAYWSERAPRVVWVALRLEDVDETLVHDHGSMDSTAARQRTTGLADRVASLARAIRERSSATILCSNFVLPLNASASPFDASDPDGLVFQVMDANRELARSLRDVVDAHVFDYAGLVADLGVSRFRDEKLYHMARVPCGVAHQSEFARRLVATTASVLRPTAKCIVVDLDNTLWGGVLGDDGLAGIQIGDGMPGRAYKAFQQALLGYRRRGILLAVASKNDEAPVLEAFASHAEQVLRREHFAFVAANWEPKPRNLERIAGALNIGLDSLVFLDDNPVERAQMRAELPMVQTVELPSDPIQYVSTLRGIASLHQPRVLGEDRNRAQAYQQSEARQEAMAAATSTAEFLAALSMVAEVGTANEGSFSRIHQLLHKTNQFNLTTRRHDAAVLSEMVASADHVVAWLRLSDRYGDLGLVCVGIVKRRSAEVWEIDTFLMSCRTMGRGVETAFIAYLRDCAQARGAKRLTGRYSASPKNHIVKNLYRDFGFTEVERSADDAEITFEIPCDGVPRWPPTIARSDAESARRHLSGEP